LLDPQDRALLWAHLKSAMNLRVGMESLGWCSGTAMKLSNIKLQGVIHKVIIINIHINIKYEYNY
jgi:hypothetical protein